MNTFLKTLRPVGNPIRLQRTSIDLSQFGRREVRFYQSGTAALAAALLSIKSIQAHKTNTPEVLLPAYACPDLISACVFAGVKPILVDLENHTCQMSLENTTLKVTADTVAIIAVRFLGIPERIKDLRNICHQHSLYLIEDSAQGFPVNSPDTYWEGDFTILSFGRGKPVNLLGGGAVLTGKEFIKHLPFPKEEDHSGYLANIKYRQKLRLYNILIRPLVYNLVTRLPGLSIGDTRYKELSALNPIPCPLINYITSNINHYKSLANIGKRWHQLIASINTTKLIDLPKLTGHDFNQPLLRYPLLTATEQHRADLYKKLKRYGASIMYKESLHHIKGVPQIVLKQGSKLPVSEIFSKTLITLPTHAAVTDDTQKEILDIIRGIIS